MTSITMCPNVPERFWFQPQMQTDNCKADLSALVVPRWPCAWFRTPKCSGCLSGAAYFSSLMIPSVFFLYVHVQRVKAVISLSSLSAEYTFSFTVYLSIIHNRLKLDEIINWIKVSLPIFTLVYYSVFVVFLNCNFGVLPHQLMINANSVLCFAPLLLPILKWDIQPWSDPSPATTASSEFLLHVNQPLLYILWYNGSSHW